MSLVVLGMEMPQTGWECPINWKGVCGISGSHYCQDKRPNWCPIRPLPEKHGRLIDADRIIEDLRFDVENDVRWLDDIDFVGKGREHLQGYKDCKQNCIYYISECETIVEAEGD